MPKVNLPLDPDVTALLERATAGRRVAGAYVNRVLRERWQDWTAALEELRGAGWTSSEILAACDALNGYWQVGAFARSGGAVAAELSDAQALNDICSKWSVAPKRWKALGSALSSQDLLAHALLVVVREFWADNAAADAAIRRERE